jgi:hypothetical protein
MREAYRWALSRRFEPSCDEIRIAGVRRSQNLEGASMRRRSIVTGFALGLAALLAWAPGAMATFHLMQVREVYPGSVAQPEADYVELQMWASGQNHVAGHVLRIYGPTGTMTGSTTFAADVAHGANQSTILLATPQAEAAFGVLADAPLAAGLLSPTGGAVCWESIDCVSWGSFSGSTPSPAGSPAAPGGIADGMALRRSIARGCATLLDPEDDHDNSALDFEALAPEPRPNSVTPTEQACPSSGGGAGGGGGGGSGGPQTRLLHKPPHRTSDRTPTFRFSSSPGGASFQCRLDSGRFKACRSPFTTRRLGFGHHRFTVRAVTDGVPDPSPASYGFRVVKPAR